MTDVMTVAGPGERLPGPNSRRAEAIYRLDPTAFGDDPHTVLEHRVRDLELVCRAQQKALNYLLLSLTAKHSRDLKEKIWPEMEAADMVLEDG